MLTCKEVSTAIAADRLERAGLWHRFQIRLHLAMCRHCRRFEAQMRAIDTAARGLYRDTEPDTERLAELESSVLATLPEGGGEAGSSRDAG
jgi:anti-sigma factor ChrR (cupin superfamily)